MRILSLFLTVSLPLAGAFSARAQAPETSTTAAVAATTSVVSALARIDNVEYGGEAFPVKPDQQVTLMPNRESPLFQAITAKPFQAEGQPVEVTERTELNISVLARTQWSVPTGKILRIGEHELEWMAPTRPGNYTIGLSVARREDCLDPASRQVSGLGKPRQKGAVAAFTMLVMYPYDRDGDGQVNGSPVGIYPNEDAENVSGYVAPRRELYRPPKWFVQLTPDVANLRVSTHFKLGDFAPDADLTKGPAYIVLSYRLIDRLEELIKELHAVGHPVKTLRIARGYVTPTQLTQLRRKGSKMAGFTRHIYGDAAVVYVDMDGDGQMDDLNRDGQVDVEDADYLGVMFDKIERRTQKFGGLGVFGKANDPLSPQTPYIEIDLRGSRARW